MNLMDKLLDAVEANEFSGSPDEEVVSSCRGPAGQTAPSGAGGDPTGPRGLRYAAQGGQAIRTLSPAGQ